MSQRKLKLSQSLYSKFDELDGSHPIKSLSPHGFVDYPARLRKGGRVSYFNYQLAKEMGLIPEKHQEVLDSELEQQILNTFGIQIINEFDQMKNRSWPKHEMKAGSYMATRYLQLQHEDKKGRTSGDGRSIWNGQIKHKGKTWDISSGGTGATCLSPATSKYNKFFETGDPSISYGCGYAELDEGIATAMLSGIFKINNIKTEETLAIIDFGNNISINVRAYQNLLRPSHFFRYLKLENLEGLRELTDYYIESQREVKEWGSCPSSKRKYDFFIRKITEHFAKLAARLEDEYIFCWLDWDGDNILMDGGIIDYGSVRQFGLCHYEYRYDDDERFSTNLMEQKAKAKYMVQSFIQCIDFLQTETKKSIQNFTNHELLDLFEQIYEQEKNRGILYHIGLSEGRIEQVLKREPRLVEDFRRCFSYFEKAKSSKGIVKIPDGVTCDAIFCMRDLLREYPQVMLVDKEKLCAEDFLEIIRSELASEEDLQLSPYRKQKIKEFQELYHRIIERTASLFQVSIEDCLQDIICRSNRINKSARVTGDAVTFMVEQILKRKKNYSADELYQLIEQLTVAQNMNPETDIKLSKISPNKTLVMMLNIIEEFREGV